MPFFISVEIFIFSGPYFPVFVLNMEIYSVNLRIKFEYGKYRTEKTPYLNTFHAVLDICLEVIDGRSYKNIFGGAGAI